MGGRGRAEGEPFFEAVIDLWGAPDGAPAACGRLANF